MSTTPSVAKEIAQLKSENVALRSENELLSSRMTQLTEQVSELVSALTVPVASLERAAVTQGASHVKSGVREDVALSRRSVLLAGGVGVFAAAAGVVIAKPQLAAAESSSGVALYSVMDFSASGSVTLSPLDTAISWAGQDPSGVPAGYTNEILSLVSDNSQTNSYSWPHYVELRATNSSEATQSSSNSVASTAKFFNRSTGSPWVAGFHSEMHHGQDWKDSSGNEPGLTPIAAQGTTIGYNCELTTLTTDGVTIGLNIQNTVHSSGNGDNAIQIQSAAESCGWSNGINFQGDSEDDIAGTTGINMTSATYDMGIDLGPNSFRFNAGQKLILEESGTTWIQCNPSTGKIELFVASTLVKSFG